MSSLTSRPTRCLAIVTLTTIALLLPQTLSPYSVAFANLQCFGTQRSEDGTTYIPNSANVNYNVWGAAAQIQFQNAQLCSTNNPASDVSAWSMITTAQGTPSQYAQTGYGRARAAAYYTTFAEYSPAYAGSNTYVRKVTTTQVTNTRSYWVTHQTGTVRLYDLDSSNNIEYILDMSYDPFYSVWNLPTYANYGGETQDPGDDVPGTSSSPVRFTNVQDKLSDAGGYGDPGPITLFVSGGYSWRYSNALLNPYPNARNFEIWTVQ